jgi:hypothetical protein
MGFCIAELLAGSNRFLWRLVGNSSSWLGAHFSHSLVETVEDMLGGKDRRDIIQLDFDLISWNKVSLIYLILRCIITFLFCISETRDKMILLYAHFQPPDGSLLHHSMFGHLSFLLFMFYLNFKFKIKGISSLRYFEIFTWCSGFLQNV